MNRFAGFWRCAFAALLMVAPLPATEAPSAAADPKVSDLVDGFKETVFSVQDLDAAVHLYTEVAGWEVFHRGRASADVARLWHLEDGQVIQEVLLRNPGETEGYLRLVHFPGVEPQLTRPGAQSWDTGGIFDVNVRVLDVHQKLAELRRHGWRAYSEPVEFSFGPFVVREVLALGPDGLVLAMIQRVQPPLEGWSNLRHFSRIFNSTQVVRDFDESFAFYTQKLGFKPYIEHEGASKEAGPNVLALPHNLTAEIPRKVAIMSPQGDNYGSVEILSFVGATGDDFAERAVPPNLGHLMLRFPVTDSSAYLALLKSRGVEPVSGPMTVEIAPYGEVPVFAIQAPEGAWLEFVQLGTD